MLGLSAGQVRSSVRSGLFTPQRGSRGEMRFSFQDLVLLRTARGLLSARIPALRIRRALTRLREQLPEGRSLASVHITAEAGGVIAADGDARWQPESGQTLFDFDAEELALRQVAPLARQAFRAAQRDAEETTADGWYALGCQLETGSPEQAREAYERAIALDPTHADARVNLGRLLHEGGDPAAAADEYRAALTARPDDTTAAFNLGVALEDMGKPRSALEAYEQAVSLDPHNADAHFNAASLCERLGRPAAALRHLKVYRNLIRERFS
ncbi:MAG: tetratricopeptide repeat protein [Thermoanaerobaculia bacterium]|nr:tetratricopeptide repeat protein [Thermoanaerobaculia bacterium]